MNWHEMLCQVDLFVSIFVLCDKNDKFEIITKER